MFSIFPIAIPNVSYLYLYPKPISMKLGEKRLIEICSNEMGIIPKEGTVFLFFNKDHDRIKLFYLDQTGSQEIMKVLPQGGFLLPVASDDQKYIKIEASKLSSLFRVSAG
jgi:transposase